MSEGILHLRFRQKRLFKGRSFFAEAFDIDFVKTIPTCPGVYLMRDDKEKLLYIGKAKNLRNRLKSYRHIRHDNAPRKSYRLIQKVKKIEWEECASEAEALLLENALLRKYQPPFNIAKAHPEYYSYIWVQALSDLEFRVELLDFDVNIDKWLTKISKKSKNAGLLIGAFKGRKGLRRALLAFGRVFWAIQTQKSNYMDLPASLVRESSSQYCSLNLPDPKWSYLLKAFWRGSSRKILLDFKKWIEVETLETSAFSLWLVRQEVDFLCEFFNYGPGRLRKLIREFELKTTFIPKSELDDYVVRWQMESGEEEENVD